jgi:hypothetical protein
VSPSDIQSFRLAVFLEDVDNICWQIRKKRHWGIDLVTIQLASVVIQLASVVDPQGRTELGRKALAQGRVPNVEQLDVHAAILQLIDEMRIFHLGCEQNYYPNEAERQIWDRISEKHRELQPIADLLEAFRPYWRTGLIIPLGSRGIHEDSSDFTRVQATWRDTNTEPFHECVRLLLFASPDEWVQRSEQLKYLANRMVADPALSLTEEEVDDLSWGLGGADSIFGPSAEDIRWSTTFIAIQRDLRTAPDSRARDLIDTRMAIAAAAQLLTPNQGVAATRRLTQVLEHNIPGRGDLSVDDDV